MFSTMSTFDDRQVIFELGLRQGTMSLTSIPSFIKDQNNENFPQRGYSTSSQQLPTAKSSTSLIGNTMGNTTKGTPNEPSAPSTPIPKPATAPNTNPNSTSKNNKNAQPTSSGAYVEQMAIAITTEKCVSQILFDRILDSKSNRKRLDIKQLVEPWLNFVQQHVKQTATSMQNKPPNWDYNEYRINPNLPEIPRCIDLVANLDHFRFRSWLSEKCVCIYTLEKISSHVNIPKNSYYTASIEAGKKKHKLDFIVYKAPQPHRRMAKNIDQYIPHNPHVASINSQTFPSVLLKIVTKKESDTSPVRNPSRNDGLYEKYSSFEIGSVADEDELFEKSEKVTVVATIALSNMKANVSEKMFGSLVHLYGRLSNETSTVIKVYEEITNSVSKIRNNFIGKHSPEHTVLTKPFSGSGYFPQTTIQIRLAFEGLDANIKLTDTPHVKAVAKSGPLNLQIVYTPEYLPVRTDKIAIELHSADYLSFEVWDDIEQYNNNDEVKIDDIDVFEEEIRRMDSADSESDGSNSSWDGDEMDENDDNEDEEAEEAVSPTIRRKHTNTLTLSVQNSNKEKSKSKHVKGKLQQTFSGTRIVINDNQLYQGNKSKRRKNGKKKNKRKKNKQKRGDSSFSSPDVEIEEQKRPVLPLHARSNVQIVAFVQRVRNQWHVSQDVHLKETQIQMTPSVINVSQMIMYKYQEEFKTTVTTNNNVIQEIDGIKRLVLSRIPTMNNMASTNAVNSGSQNGIIPDHATEYMSTIPDHDTEFASHMSYTNTMTKASVVSVTSSQKLHDKNIMNQNNNNNNNGNVNTATLESGYVYNKTDQLSVPALSPNAVQTGHYFPSSAQSPAPLHSNMSNHSEKKDKRKKVHLQQQMDATEAMDVAHIYLTSMVSVKNFLCVAVMGPNNMDRPLLSNPNARELNGGEQCQFISIYCQEAQSGIKSNDLYSDAKMIKLSIDIRASNVIAGLDEKINVEDLWKIERYEHFERLFSNRWRFIEFNARNEFKHTLKKSIWQNQQMNRANSQDTPKYFVKSNIVVADVKSVIQPNILQLIMNITETYPNRSEHFQFESKFGMDSLHHGPRITEFVGDKANNSLESNILNGNKKQISPHWDLDMNFEWRGGKLELETPNKNQSKPSPNTVLSLPYIKLFSSILFSAEQIESDTFLLINFDKISLDMHFLQFVGATIECVNIATERHNFNHRSSENDNHDEITATSSNRVSNHTLCVSIANLNTTLSCQPIYDKLECVFNVNDPISICWCHTTLDQDNNSNNNNDISQAPYTDILTIAIPKVSMKILQKFHTITHVRFDLDIQRSQGHNLRSDGLPIITTLISLEKVVIQTSALGIITTNLFLQCMQKQLSQVSSSNFKPSQSDPQSPSQDQFQQRKKPATYFLFSIKDKIRFVCDLKELPLINTHVKAGLDQFTFQYQDDGRLDNSCDHLIRGRLTCRGVIELSDRNRSGPSPYNKHSGKHQKMKQQQNYQHTSQHSAASMLGTIMNLASMTNQTEPGSSWKRKHGALMKKLEPLQGSFRMNDVMTISFLHHYNQNQRQYRKQYLQNPFESVKCGINRLQIKIPQTNILLKTLTLRKIIEVNTTSPLHLEIEDSPKIDDDDDDDNQFMVNIVLELEEGIVVRLAPHSIPYILSGYYTITEFMKREQNDIAAHLQQNNMNNKEKENGSITSGNHDTDTTTPNQSQTMSKSALNNLSLSESVFVCHILLLFLCIINHFFHDNIKSSYMLSCDIT